MLQRIGRVELQAASLNIGDIRWSPYRVYASVYPGYTVIPQPTQDELIQAARRQHVRLTRVRLIWEDQSLPEQTLALHEEESILFTDE